MLRLTLRTFLVLLLLNERSWIVEGAVISPNIGQPRPISKDISFCSVYESEDRMICSVCYDGYEPNDAGDICLMTGETMINVAIPSLIASPSRFNPTILVAQQPPPGPFAAGIFPTNIPQSVKSKFSVIYRHRRSENRPGCNVLNRIGSTCRYSHSTAHNAKHVSVGIVQTCESSFKCHIQTNLKDHGATSLFLQLQRQHWSVIYFGCTYHFPI